MIKPFCELKLIVGFVESLINILFMSYKWIFMQLYVILINIYIALFLKTANNSFHASNTICHGNVLRSNIIITIVIYHFYIIIYKELSLCSKIDNRTISYPQRNKRWHFLWRYTTIKITSNYYNWLKCYFKF